MANTINIAELADNLDLQVDEAVSVSTLPVLSKWFKQNREIVLIGIGLVTVLLISRKL